MSSKEIDSVIIATNEGRELSRIRNSVSFRIGVLITDTLRKPWRIITFPVNLFKILMYSKNPTSVSMKGGCMILGIDAKGSTHAELAISIHKIVSSPSNIVHLLTTHCSEICNEFHSIIPTPRALSVSDPKAWNLLAERYISTMLICNSIERVIFVSDYPFKGVLRAFSQFPNIKCCWVKTPLPNQLEKQIKHESGNFEIVLNADEINLEIVPDIIESLPLQRRKGWKNVLIDLPAKNKQQSREEAIICQRLIGTLPKIDVHQVSYLQDKLSVQEVPPEYLDRIDWKTVDLLICDGSIDSLKRIDNCDAHILCLPDKSIKRDTQAKRLAKKSMNEDIIVLFDPHEAALDEALINLLRRRPAKGELRRIVNGDTTKESTLDNLISWIN